MLDKTSGLTAVATVSDTAVTALTDAGGQVTQVTIINEGAVAGFFQVNGDGGEGDWCRLPAGPSAVTNSYRNVMTSVSVKIKRIAGGSNLSGVYVSAR
jgi:hypothetical protein